MQTPLLLPDIERTIIEQHLTIPQSVHSIATTISNNNIAISTTIFTIGTAVKASVHRDHYECNLWLSEVYKEQDFILTRRQLFTWGRY